MRENSNETGQVTRKLDYRAAGNGPDERDAPNRQSPRGLASFFIGLSIVLGVPLVILWFASTWPARSPHPLAWLLDAVLITAAVLSLIGLGLGIACVPERQRKKVLGIIGLILNGGVVALMLYILVCNVLRP